MSLSNNDVFRRFRYALNISDATMVQAFTLGKNALPLAEIAYLLKNEKDSEFVECADEILSAFFDGFIIQKRGVRENAPGAPNRPSSPRLNNNDILKKIRIALELRDDDLVAVMRAAGVAVSSSEFGALFRQKKHPKYKLCGDQFLRNFLTGLETWRPGKVLGEEQAE